jgi:hypothetical protein
MTHFLHALGYVAVVGRVSHGRHLDPAQETLTQLARSTLSERTNIRPVLRALAPQHQPPEQRTKRLAPRDAERPQETLHHTRHELRLSRLHTRIHLTQNRNLTRQRPRRLRMIPRRPRRMTSRSIIPQPLQSTTPLQRLPTRLTRFHQFPLRLRQLVTIHRDR